MALFRAHLVHTPALGHLTILKDRFIEVDNNGFITNISTSSTREPSVSIPDGSFLLPTFCDLHLHAPQFLYQGTGLHLPLMEWLNQYAFKAEERLDSDPALAERVYRKLAQRLLENGTGAVSLFGTIKPETNIILARVMHEAGIRAYIGKLSMNISSRETYKEASTQSSLADAKAFIHECRGLVEHLPTHARLIEPIITPRFVPTCSDDLLKGLGVLSQSEGQVKIQSHLAESKDEVELVKNERGVDDIEMFQRNGLLTPHTIQAHCTFLPQASLTQLSQIGTSVAHCPLSNSYFSAKPFKLREALDAGVKVGLGSDIAGGYELGINGAMRTSVAVSRMREGERFMSEIPGDVPLSVDWKESLYLATKGGAIAMGLPEGCGEFKVGAPFDAQLIKIHDPDAGLGVGALDFFDKFDLKEEAVEKWWCLGDVRNRSSVWVQGVKLFDHKSTHMS